MDFKHCGAARFSQAGAPATPAFQAFAPISASNVRDWASKAGTWTRP
jgi:hypothetical protein